MEFLGDSVLGFVVSAWLLEQFPILSEGKLSKIKSYLVSEASLVEMAEDLDFLDLGRYILLNRGEEKTGGRRKRALLADAYEALIGAVYIDGGVSVAEKFLRREMRHKLMAIDPTSMIGADYKSALQERLQAAGGPAPEYVVVEVMGPDHRRTFRVELRVGGRALALGEGHTIKIAQQEAAREVLALPDVLDPVEVEQPDEPQAFGEEAINTSAVETKMEFDGLEQEPKAGESFDFDESGIQIEEVSSDESLSSIMCAGGALFEQPGATEVSADEKAEDEAQTVATDAGA
jgi:ribonuclease-3